MGSGLLLCWTGIDWGARVGFCLTAPRIPQAGKLSFEVGLRFASRRALQLQPE